MPKLAERPYFMRRGLIVGALMLATAGCATQVVDTPPKSVVFFTAMSGALEPAALGAIHEFAKDAMTAPNRPVIVQGFADKIGTPQANLVLSQLRAQVVADALVKEGVASSRIVQRPRGATLADPGIESRRVDIELGR